MTRFLLVVSLLGLTAFDVHAQADYLEYHRSILQAEELIIERNYNVALSVYEKAFAAYEFIFLKDYKVASQIAILTNEHDKALKYIELGILKGWPVKSIERTRIFAPILEYPEWAEIKLRYGSGRKIVSEEVDDALRLQVRQMYKKDQKKAFGALLRIGQKAQDRYAENKFAPHSEEQMERLNQILTTRGYPGEQLIGNNYWVSTIVSHHNSISKEYVLKDTLFSHLKPKLMRALKNGEISPFEFALMEDWKTAVEKSRNSTAYGYLGRINSDSVLNEINKNRIAIGLRTIEMRNALVDIENETGINFYLPGEPWKEGKITIASKKGTTAEQELK